MPTPEAAARENIDAALQSAGWHVQDFAELNLAAGLGVAVREFPLARGHGKADYALYVAGKLAGVVEAKKEGTLLTGIEVQSEKYARGVPPLFPAHVLPLPFLYESTGVEAQFANRLDPEPRSRRLFHFHKPETLAEWFDPEQNPPPLLPELLQRDKVSLDIFWLKDESLEDSANLPAPDVIAGESVDDLRAALEQFEAIQTDLSRKGTQVR